MIVSSVGERMALALLIRMPEFGLVTREQPASLAGLAPVVHQSGKWQGQTRIGGGRSRLRRSLEQTPEKPARSLTCAWSVAYLRHRRMRAQATHPG